MKNIFIVHRPGGAFGYITDGWINALRDRGYNVQRWDGQINSWNTFKPDLYIGSSGHRQPIPRDPNCLIAMHVNPFGPIDCGPINEPKQSIDYIKNLNPNVVFGYGFNEDRIYWQYWTTKLGIIWCPMPTGADATVFKNLVQFDQRPLDAVYIGGRWTYKAKSIDVFLIPMKKWIEKHNKTMEIHGWGEWQDGVSHGVISDDVVTATFNRAKIGPCVSEPHTQEWGFDLPERIWKVAACGCLPVHDPVPTLRQILPNLPMGQNKQRYAELCLYYINNLAEASALANSLHDEVMNNHTYHHRLAGLFRSLGWNDEAHHMLA